MSRVLTTAQALYKARWFYPGAAFDKNETEANICIEDARVALMANGDFGWCRVCGGPTRILASLGTIPLANHYSVDAPRHLLRVELCDACVLPQLEETVAPEKMFTNYQYRSGMSQTYRASARDLVERQQVPNNGFVVEIGSNDGVLLSYYPHHVRVLGVDPGGAETTVQTLAEYFDARLADDIVHRHGLADVVHANNVVAHCPDPHSFFQGVYRLLKRGGKAYVETPYIENLVYAWDTIYHEHVFYWSATALVRAANKARLVVTEIEPLELHGGSLRYTLEKQGDLAPGLAQLLDRERHMRLTGLQTRINYDVKTLRTAVEHYRQQGKRVCGYGAAAKGAVTLAAAKLDLDFVCDTTPGKIGGTMPGTRIPIVPTDCLANADVAVMFAWNYQEEVLNREHWWKGIWLHPHEVNL